MKRRTPNEPPIKLKIWKRDGKLWRVEKSDLEELIARSQLTDEEIRSRFGCGYSSLLSALSGKSIDGWSAVFIESGLRTKEECAIGPTQSWPPINSKN